MAFKKKQPILNTCVRLSGIKVLEFPSLILQMSYFCHISIDKDSDFARNKYILIKNNSFCTLEHTFCKLQSDFNTCKLFLQVCSKFQSSLIASYHATYHLLWKNILTLGSQHIWRISTHTNIFSYLFRIVLLLGSQTENKQILKLNPLTRFNDFQFKGWSLLWP